MRNTLLSLAIVLAGCGGREGGDPPERAAGAEPRVVTAPGGAASGAASGAGGGSAAVNAGAPVGGVESRAAARLHPVAGSGVSGTLTFTSAGGRLAVKPELAGLNGEALLQVYGGGGCSDPASLSEPLSPSGAGGAAASAPPAPPASPGVAPAAGAASGPHFARLSGGAVALSPGFDAVAVSGAGGLVGKAVVVHAPGAAPGTEGAIALGKPVACGIITKVEGG